MNENKWQMSKKPNENVLENESWYFGNISRTEAEEILKKSKLNKYLVRDSSQPGCFACSMIDVSKNAIYHTLIINGPNGYSFKGIWILETKFYSLCL